MSWAKIPAAAEHYGVSVRTFRTLLRESDFPRSRLPSGTFLIELEAGDQWLRDRSEPNENDRVIENMVKELT